jgi:hypothetical protein
VCDEDGINRKLSEASSNRMPILLASSTLGEYFSPSIVGAFNIFRKYSRKLIRFSGGISS